MKQRAKSLLALASMALMGIFVMLAMPVTAHAQTFIKTVSNGGVNCTQWDPTVTWPATFWNCDSTKTAVEAQVIATAANRIPTKFRTYLNTTEIYVFRNAADFGLFFNTAIPATNKMGARLPGVAAVFSQAQQPVKPPSGPAVITTIDLSPYYMANIVQQLGQTIDEAINFTGGTTSGQTFTAALTYDRDYMNSAQWEGKGEQAVWPDIYQLYPGQTAFGILGSAYGNTPREVFGYQFEKLVTNIGDTVPILVNGVNEMPNTYGLIKNYVYDSSVTNPAVSFYNATQNKHLFCVQQDPYGSSTWPSKYWNCAHPYNPTSAENTALSAMRTTIGPQPPKIPVAWRNLYSSNNTELWITRNVDDPRWFFGWMIPGGTGYFQLGLTVGSAHRSTIYRWEKRDATTISEITAFYPDTASHELGHVLEFLLGNGTVAGGAASKPGFQAALAADRLAFDALPCSVAIDANAPGENLCANNPGKSNWWIATNKKGLEDTAQEHWARAFAKQLPGNSQQFVEGVQALMTNENNYMHTAFQTGTVN